MTDSGGHSRNTELERLRDSIDELDRVLVKLLNQRAKYALEVGRVKREISVPIFSPEREREVLEHVERQNLGPLSVEALRRLYERIIDESRRLEREGRAPKGERQEGNESC
jgi:chorismate mutase